jgi:serine/threonine-protein kinase
VFNTSAGVTRIANDLTGQVLSDRYRILERIGEGGMGMVYRAEHIHMRKTLAIKVLHAELTTVEEVVQRFEREAQAAANIEHPNVCAATDFGRSGDGGFFLVMEYIEGASMDQVIAKEGALPLRRVVTIARQICAALARAHQMGIVHRDLKPENVLLVEREGMEDFVKVLDFGIARVPVVQDEENSQTLTRAGLVMGTPAYLSPEQAAGSEVDHRSDLYSLGVMLFEMTTGERPFQSASAVELISMHLTRDPPAVNSLLASGVVPQSFEQLVRQLLEKKFEDRPAGAAEVGVRLDEIEQDLSLLEAKRESRSGQDRARVARERLNTAASGVIEVFGESRKAAPAMVQSLRTVPAWVWPLGLIIMVLAVSIGWSSWSRLFRSDEVEVPTQTTRDSAGLLGKVRQLANALSPLERQRREPTVKAILDQREKLGAKKVGKTLRDLYKQNKSPELAFIIAEVEGEVGNSKRALQYVSKALSESPELAKESPMQTYVFEQLKGRERDKAAALIQEHYMPALASRLASLACEDHSDSGRDVAQDLLVQGQVVNDLPQYCQLVIQLERAESCPARRTVVRQMKELGDPRALPSLRRLEPRRGRRSLFRRRRGKNSCLVSDWQKAVRHLEAGLNGDSS